MELNSQAGGKARLFQLLLWKHTYQEELIKCGHYHTGPLPYDEVPENTELELPKFCGPSKLRLFMQTILTQE